MARFRQVFTGLLLVGASIVSYEPSKAHAANEVLVSIDGKMQVFDQPPVVVNNRTLVPLRGIFEALHATIEWNQETQTVTATKGDMKVSLQIGSKRAEKNGQSLYLDVEAQLINDRTMVPARFVSEALGASVNWDGEKQTVRIYSNGILNDDVKLQVINGDGNVPAEKIQQVQQLITEHKLLDQISQDYQISFQQPVQIYLAANKTGYQQLVLEHGHSAEEAAKIAKSTDGLASGNSIYIPLDVFQTDTALLGIITHELVHVVFNQFGLWDLPSWINEGLAWHTQLKLEHQEEPAIVQESTRIELNHSILKAKEEGKLSGLSNDSEETLNKLASNPGYNVEIQDWVAVEQLIHEYGMEKVLTYLRSVQQWEDAPFQQTFGVSPLEFENRLNSTLAEQIQNANKAEDKGVKLTFEITSAFHGEFAVQPFNQRNVQVYRLQPGTYSAVIQPNGTIEGLGAGSPAVSSGNGDPNFMYVMLRSSGSVMLNGQSVTFAGFAIRHDYGQYYLSNGWITNQAGQVQYHDTDVLMGVRIIAIETL